MQKEITIINRLGLHARAAAKLVTLASQFESEIQLARGAQRINAKSIMGVMMLAAAKGARLELSVEGEDAEEAMTRIEQLVQERFGESE
jgi:phosphocarrier protein